MKKTHQINLLILILLSFYFILPTPKVAGQDTQVLFSVDLKKVEKVSLDRFFNFYITDAKGTIYQYSAEGTLLNRFSPPKPGSVALLEAWQGVKIFSFYQDFQQIQFLDRFLAPIQNLDLEFPELGFVRLATLSNDNNVWLLDDSDFSLKKYHIQNQKITINNPLNLQVGEMYLDLTHLREFQNLLFISDAKNGIHIFDNMGNYLKTLPSTGTTYFNFYNDEIYFIEANMISFYNIYNFKKRSFPLPNSNYRFALATKQHLILISENKADFIQHLQN